MKGRRVRLTDTGVGKLKPDKTEYAVWDSEVSGLGVRVRPSGHRSFVWHGRVQGEPVRATVGPAAIMSVEEARKRALTLSVGDAPRKAEGRSGTPLFRDFVLDEWWPAYRHRCAPSSCRSANGVLKRQLIPAFGRLPLDAIRRIDVERWFDAYSRTAPGGANKALDILGQIMNAALAAGHVETASVKGIAKNPRPKLTRFLSGEEIERLHRVLDRLVGERPSRGHQADIIRLLLLTGCRKGEILKLRWSEVDGDRLNLVHTKTGPRGVWLSQAAQAILARQPHAAGPYVFQSPKHPDKPLSPTLHLWHRVRKEAGLDDVRLHDLRHTVASQAVAQGVPLSTVARMLGHADPVMTLRYAHVADRDLQNAVERIGKAIEAAMETGESLAPACDGQALALRGVRPDRRASARRAGTSQAQALSLYVGPATPPRVW